MEMTVAKHLFRLTPVARPYLCFQRDPEGGGWVAQAFPDYDSLARHVRRLANYAWPWSAPDPKAAFARLVRAETPNGFELDLEVLSARGLALWREGRDNRRYAGYVRRAGPVPGVSRPRGGHYFRRMRTSSERRLNEMVLVCEGEVAARPCRTGYGLPNPWDDVLREKQRSWKSQHKGRKAWDRRRHGGDLA